MKFLVEIEVVAKEELTKDQRKNLDIFDNSQGIRDYLYDHIYDLTKHSDVFPSVILVRDIYIKAVDNG